MNATATATATTFSLATIDLFAATPAFTLDELRQSKPCSEGYATLLRGIVIDCKLKNASDIDKLMNIPLLYVLQNNGIRDVVWCMRINWFKYKQLYMQFVNSCVDAADVAAADVAASAAAASAAAAYAAASAAAADYAADAAARAADAADAADYAADAADYAADAARAAYAAAAAEAERNQQAKHLAQLLVAAAEGTTL